MTILLQISDTGEIKIPLDMIIQSGMHPGDIIEATIEGGSVILNRTHPADRVQDEFILQEIQNRCIAEKELEDPSSWDPSPFFGSLKHAFAGRTSVEIGKDIRDEWERV